MKLHTQPIQLNSAKSERLTKRAALIAFRGVRSLCGLACELPHAVVQATIDVRAAWRESARPNV